MIENVATVYLVLATYTHAVQLHACLNIFLIGWLLPTKFIPYNLWYRNSYFDTLQIVVSYKTQNEMELARHMLAV